MKIKAISPILNVSDVPESVRWFEKIGWFRGFTWNRGGMIQNAALENGHGPAHFGGLCANDQESDHGPMIFLCQDGQGSRDPRPWPGPGSDEERCGGVWMSWWVEDIDQAHAECVKAGVEVLTPPGNRPWNVREFLIRHPDGHYFRFSGPVK